VKHLKNGQTQRLKPQTNAMFSFCCFVLLLCANQRHLPKCLS